MRPSSTHFYRSVVEQTKDWVHDVICDLSFIPVTHQKAYRSTLLHIHDLNPSVPSFYFLVVLAFHLLHDHVGVFPELNLILKNNFFKEKSTS